MLAFVTAVAMWMAPSHADPPLNVVVHAVLERSVPAAGDTLVLAPSQLLLTFSGPVEETGALVRLLGPGGAAWVLELQHAEGDARSLQAELPDLPPGGYRVEWRVVSADGHPVQDGFTFFVAGDGSSALAAPPPPSGEVPPDGVSGNGGGPSGAAALLIGTRAGADIALLGAAGLLLFVTFGTGAPSALTYRAAKALAIAAPVFATAHAWLWTSEALSGVASASARLDELTGLTTGRSLGGEALLAWMVLWALLLARRFGLATVFAVAAIVVGGLGGHPASYTPIVAVPTGVIHQLAVAVWIGGLLYLVTERGAPDFARAAHRVSAAALGAVVLVTTTGLVQAWLVLDAPARLVTSTFGLLVLAKVAGLACLVAFGAHHRFRLLPAVASTNGPARLARSVRAELAVAAVVVLVAAVLSHTPPNP